MPRCRVYIKTRARTQTPTKGTDEMAPNSSQVWIRFLSKLLAGAATVLVRDRPMVGIGEEQTRYHWLGRSWQASQSAKSWYHRSFRARATPPSRRTYRHKEGVSIKPKKQRASSSAHPRGARIKGEPKWKNNGFSRRKVLGSPWTCIHPRSNSRKEEIQTNFSISSWWRKRARLIRSNCCGRTRAIICPTPYTAHPLNLSPLSHSQISHLRRKSPVLNKIIIKRRIKEILGCQINNQERKWIKLIGSSPPRKCRPPSHFSILILTPWQALVSSPNKSWARSLRPLTNLSRTKLSVGDHSRAAWTKTVIKLAASQLKMNRIHAWWARIARKV